MTRIILAAAIWLASPAAALAAGPQGFALHETPQNLPNIRFVTEDGAKGTLEDFRGKVILLNIWATWCPPCVEEMPTLDALQAELGGPGFEVVALSIDRAGPDVVRKFLNRIGVVYLELYVDETRMSYTALLAVGLPATLLIDAEGRELGRLIGPADWDDPEMVSFLRGYLE